MIEPIMYIGIGFLVAGLLVIGVIPLVHARAVRLTLRRLEALGATWALQRHLIFCAVKARRTSFR